MTGGADEVRDALLGALDGGEVAAGRPVRVEELALRGDHVMSLVFAGREAETDRPIVVKAVRPREGGGEHVEREWSVLAAIDAARDAGDLPAHVAPVPIARLADPNAIVMEESPGARLDERTSRGVRFPGRLFSFGRLVGAYVAATESLAVIATVLGARPAAIETTPAPLEEIARVQREAGAWDQRLADNVLGLAVDLAVGPPVGGFKHGNFAPWNVLVTPAGATVLDFQEAEQPGTWLDDVAQMTIHLQIAREQGGLRESQAQVLVRAVQGVGSMAAGGTADLPGRYLYELCRLHSWYTGAVAGGNRECVRPRGEAVGGLLRSFVAGGGRELPWG